jgi:diketogulonate reductase-like aldo/keto reductase
VYGHSHPSAKTWTRRQILKLAAAGAAAAAGGAPIKAQMTNAKQLMRTIPGHAEQLPAMGLGTYSTFDVGAGDSGRAPLREVLRLFVDLGGRVVDSSPMYGSAESVVGDLATDLGVRDKLFLATKVWINGREAGIRQMRNSMQRMRAEKMDLMQVHNLVDVDTHLATLRAWKDEGLVRYLGITHYTESAYDSLERLMQREPLDFVQLNYSIESRDAERRLLPLAQERGIGIIVNRPFEQAGLFGKVRGAALPAWAAEFDCASWAQFFLKYILAHPAVTCVIPATSKPKHLVDNMQAGLGRLPNAKMRETMIKFLNSV